MSAFRKVNSKSWPSHLDWMLYPEQEYLSLIGKNVVWEKYPERGNHVTWCDLFRTGGKDYWAGESSQSGHFSGQCTPIGRFLIQVLCLTLLNYVILVYDEPDEVSLKSLDTQNFTIANHGHPLEIYYFLDLGLRKGEYTWYGCFESTS